MNPPNQNLPRTPPDISPIRFWDVDIAAIDWEKHAFFVIERVFDRGNLKEFMSVLNFYSADQVQDVVKHSRSLTPRMRNYCAILFGIDPKDICITKPCFPELWKY
jgi:hypothetical protein